VWIEFEIKVVGQLSMPMVSYKRPIVTLSLKCTVFVTTFDKLPIYLQFCDSGAWTWAEYIICHRSQPCWECRIPTSGQ